VFFGVGVGSRAPPIAVPNCPGVIILSPPVGDGAGTAGFAIGAARGVDTATEARVKIEIIVERMLSVCRRN